MSKSSLATVRPTSSLAGRVGESRAVARVARAILFSLLARSRGGRLTLIEEATERRLGRGELAATVRIHDDRTYSALLRHGSVGLGISYLEGWWDSDDVVTVIRILIRAQGPVRRTLDAVGRLASIFLDPLRRRRLRRGRHEDRRMIRAHYDVGNDLFALMLDPTMSYSCAYFARPDVTLEEASIAKIDRLAAMLELGPDDHLLEIGTGWGGLATHVARTYGCRVTTTTISAEQFAAATQRVEANGLGDRVTVLHDDYRDLTGTYDKLVSVEMIEAVDWREVPGYFRECARFVRPGGRMALQAIVIDDDSYDRAKVTTDFIKEFIFPGGSLPSVRSLLAASASAGWRLARLDDIGPHYAETLHRWRERFDNRRDEVTALGYDERFRRLWTLYLTYCEGAFLERHVSDVQVLLERPLS